MKLPLKLQVKKTLLAVICSLPLFFFSQIKSATIGIDGLHCSACSFGTENSLRKLDFIEDVKMDLNKHIAEITFKDGKQIQLDQLAKKVVDAGFSVRSIYIEFNFEEIEAKNNSCFESNGIIFSFTGVKDQLLKGTQALQLIGKNFMPKAEFRKWKLIPVPICSNPVSSSPSIKSYYVTI